LGVFISGGLGIGKNKKIFRTFVVFFFFIFLSKGFELMDAIRDICSLEFCFGVLFGFLVGAYGFYCCD
jgi:hypothetical protein